MNTKHLFLTVTLALTTLGVAQATDYIRYVSKTKGAYNNDGTTWASAKVNVQDAINDIQSKLESGDRGYVFVEAGVYRPTQSVAGTGSSTLYMSIQIPAGVSVYGGFLGTETGSNAQAIIEKRQTIDTEIGTYMKNQTIFTGSLSSQAVYEWNTAKHRYVTSYYGNCYHVVWFGTNGYNTLADGTPSYKALADSAVLDGVVIRDGYAFNSDIKKAQHNAFGGGAYLVENAIVRNCEVYHCEASRGGAGFYLDHGGRVENCYVHDCQTLGINSMTGFGGGIEVNQKGVVTHCALINNVGRSGGGLSLNYNPSEDPTGAGQYALAASCCLVAQNVATVEAGGVYLNQGGLLNGMTIVKNKTYGTGVTLNGIVTGRSGGVYIRDHARLYNSVLWGNETNANNTNNIQYAATRSSSTNELKPLMAYVAISRADYTDWSGTKKMGISKLADDNVSQGASSSLEKYAMFTTIHPTCGHIADQAGKAMDASSSYLKSCLWVPTSSSGLCYAGLQLLDINESSNIDISEGYITDDLIGNEFSPKCTLGSYTAVAETPAHTVLQGVNTIFVDPNRESGSEFGQPGISWDSPLDNLTDALIYFKERGLTGQVLVKEGTLYTASRSAHNRLRGTTIPMVSGVNVYGSYAAELTGTDTSRRNPVSYPTIISGKVTEGDYASNVAHLVTFDGVTNSTLDGFELRWANASNLADNANGGGIQLIDAQGISLKNILIAGCAAQEGAAVYATGSSSAHFENCIFHNNQVCRNYDEAGFANTLTGGVLHVGGTSQLTFNHCDILRNVGYALHVEATANVTVSNNVFFANQSEACADTKKAAHQALAAFHGATSRIVGQNNMFDIKSSATDTEGQPTIYATVGKSVLTLDGTDERTYARFSNPTKNAGVSEGGDITYYGRATDFTPHSLNPIVNAASYSGDHTTWGIDMIGTTRDFGGRPDVGAVENCIPTEQPAYGTTIYVRDYNTYSYNADGTVRDTISIDRSTTNPDGTLRDGMSWANAINGNAGYPYVQDVYTPVTTIQTSTIENPVLYRLSSMFNNGRYHLKWNANNYFYICLEESADEFIFIESGTPGLYYIYDYTVKKYCRYTSTGESTKSVLVQDAQSGNTLWQVDPVGGTICPQNSTNSWNYRGTSKGQLGLYRKTDANSKSWWFEQKSTQELPLNGLQYAVNCASDAMTSGTVTRTETVTEHSGNISPYDFTVTHYYYDKKPDATELAVWVGAGIYTNTRGFQIKNHAKVYGGFPRIGSPGMEERHPQLSLDIPLSEENQSLGLQVKDYETILQTHHSIAERDASYTADINSSSVLWHPAECRLSTDDNYDKPASSRVIYEDCVWDGFTMRYGYKRNCGGRNGGAGVQLYENVEVRNCVIRDNLSAKGMGRLRGAGIYCDGAQSKIINCFVMDNLGIAMDGVNNGGHGGGLFMIHGTAYNSVFCGNELQSKSGGTIRGAGCYFESANFYNNTVVANRGASALGVWSNSKEESHLTLYNCIIMAGDQYVLERANTGIPIGFSNCFLQSSKGTVDYSGSNTNITYGEENYINLKKSAIEANPFALDYNTAVANYDYRIRMKDAYNCVNLGTEDLGYDMDGKTPVVLPDVDMDYTDRVQDCRVDIGAYEYNGAASITPDVTTMAGAAIYYVSELGFGSTQAYNPANAACAPKLQKVLDAAGRYKATHPDVRIIVKLAGVDATVSGYRESSCFKYYPCRTSDENNDNVRVWSIQVPRGVEVWGGYTVEGLTANQAAAAFTDDERSVMYHPTFLQTAYTNRHLHEEVKAYHVVTFTDRIYDIDGNPYLAGDVIENVSLSSYEAGTSYEESDFAHLSDKNVTDRAVLDGLFLVGGQADGENYGSAASQVNINQYGGAAVVTDFAHVRNCILKNNTATYGGALALMNKGLVSGCLIIDNEAEYGGGVYVVEDGVTMSDGVQNNTSQGDATTLDANMPHVYTSTIVKNMGVVQGGGLWFSNDAAQPNVRVNSTVLWQNDSPDQANVAGQTSPDLPSDNSISTFEWYPFAYSAVQSVRVSGTSNIYVDIQNRSGNRFGVDSKTDSTVYDGKVIAIDTTQVNYYGLTIFSALCRTGMPYTSYEELVNTMGLSQLDYNKWNRDTVPVGTNARSYIDIGARAYPSSPTADLNHPFLRLFVAETQDVNMEAYQAMQDYAAEADENDPNYIYGLLGSSFAYPFQNLDDALEYISELRKHDMWRDKANNMPFEICIARGDYFPQRDMQGNYGYSLANTFLIPEGVILTGGFDCNNLYGQYLKPSDLAASQYTTNLNNNVVRFSNDTLNTVGLAGKQIELIQLPLDTLSARRIQEDLNFNNILEPWEFQNQTNLSGNAVNLQNSGVYHVVSVIPYAPGVGQLPTPTYVNPDYDAHGQQNGYGLESKYVGQPVVIDGVHISDGYAQDYVDGSLNDIGIYDYYRGAGLHGTGNWYCEQLDGSDDDLKHQNIQNAVAYRDIPLYIRNSQFINNQAGYGAAMDVNISTYIYNCLFAENKALAQTETVNWIVSAKTADYGQHKKTTISYPGQGAAIFFSKELEVYNTIFSNNEAVDEAAVSSKSVTYAAYPTLQNPTSTQHTYGGAGAAICGGYNSHLKVLNCDIVNNRACLYPGIFTMNPNHGLDYLSAATETDYNLVANTLFWGNDVTPGVGSENTFAQGLCINYSNEPAGSAQYDIQLSKAPQSQTDLDNNFSEALWFSAYEKGRASTAVNSNDYRMLKYNPEEYISKTLYQYWADNYAEAGSNYRVQNINITLSSDNDDIEGPNFCNPSATAGFDGYNEAADWSRARLNNLTDNGSTFLSQDVIDAGPDGFIVSWQRRSDESYEGDGAYYETYYATEENERSMDMGFDIYMRSVATNANLPRVAADPSPTHRVAYIDIGVYEYPHSKLVPYVEGDAVDILWVSTIERPENGTPDGKLWETPTSDLQRAIETLMASRNGHRKEIRIMDGEYAPMNTFNGFRSFYINTKELNNEAYFPAEAFVGDRLKSDTEDLAKLFVRSLTIKGGYSKDLRDQYDTELYPATIRSTERLDGTSETWNHLLLIDDATQRYGRGETPATGFGSKIYEGQVTTIPIQIDGLHFVNNQALAGTHGAAIRYNDQVNNYINEGTPYTDYVDAPLSANVSITKAEYDALKNVPNSGVNCTYWTDDTYTIPSTTGPTNYVLYYRTIQHPSKLTLTKCCVMNSGTHYDASTLQDYSSSAVYIGQYGGDALIYNSVFHSNWGNPLEAYNTRTVNNTVALNYGRWILMNSGTLDDYYESGSETGTGEMLAPGVRRLPQREQEETGSGVITMSTYQPRHSKIMNTVLWRNNPATEGGALVYGKQFALDGYVSDRDAASDSIFRRNSYTRYENGALLITEGTDYNDTAFVHNYWNTYLSLDNQNISTGPNFKDPKMGATDAQPQGEIEQRDFSLLPSVRLVDKGDTLIYSHEVYDMAWIPTTELDYLDQNRVISLSIEVGAIEYPQPLLRVIYVDPTQQENKTGLGWGSTMNAENLQNAIDMAAIYSATNPVEIDPVTQQVIDRNEAYVFVKGDNHTTFPEVTLRSGVNVFGSIDPNNVTDSVRYTIDERTGQYLYPYLQEDVQQVINNRPGLVGISTERTIVPYVTTGQNNAFDTERPTRLDGVEISATSSANPSGAILEPVLDINPTSMVDGEIPAVAITNILVADNDATGSQVNVANVNNSLIYEVLFRDNKVDNGNYVLNLGETGYGVNLTVEGKTSDAANVCEYPTTDDQYAPQRSHIWYSIYNYAGHPADQNTLSAYNYELEEPNLNYQLTEHSLNIDRCPARNPMLLSAATANLVEFINYDTDVDLLANPRVLDIRKPGAARKLDRGAFETWVVGNDTVGQTVYTNIDRNNYYGNYYPHEGSVVYLLENSNLISEAHSLLPGYLLVKRGASLYAHGQTVKAAYVAVERDMTKSGAVVAVPYAMDYNFWQNTSHGPATYSYDGNGVLTLVPDANTTTSTYNGSVRAAARYQIQNQNSSCWDLVARDAEPIPACQGVFFTCSKDDVYRFTGKGGSLKSYIYYEQPQVDGDGNLITVAKSVILEQNNNAPLDGKGNLTADEDMGWNCFGIPYLVSDYKPYRMAYDAQYNTTATSVEYMMHLPKQLWLYYDGLQTLNDFGQVNSWTSADAINYAGFYAAPSWSNVASEWHLATAPRLWVGEGMFAQTASFADEDLRFYLPIFEAGEGAAPMRKQVRFYVGSGIEEELDRTEALKQTIYDLQGRKVQSPTQHGVYVIDGKRVWL